MTARQIVAEYYDAWKAKQGDLSQVPLADDFTFTGPVASFDSAEGFRAMAREAGQAVTSFNVGRMTAAEVLEVKDGLIVRGELIYDAEELRRAMAQVSPDPVASADG